MRVWSLLLLSCGLAACADSSAQDLARPSRPKATQGEPLARVQSLESSAAIVAQFNPKELAFDKEVSWSKTKKSSDDAPTLAYEGSSPKTLDFELMFDTFEEQTDVAKRYLSQLDQMTAPSDKTRRPPMVSFTWGSAMPTFQGVISSLNVKYTMFMPDGVPVRATVQVKMKQASKLVSGKKAESPSESSCAADSDCDSGEVCQHGSCVP